MDYFISDFDICKKIIYQKNFKFYFLLYKQFVCWIIMTIITRSMKKK